MARPWLAVAALGLLLVAVVAVAGASERGSRGDRCADTDNPERCQHAMRLRAHCREHPADVQHCGDGHHARMRAYCAENPRDDRCQAHTDRVANHREMCANHPEHDQCQRHHEATRPADAPHRPSASDRPATDRPCANHPETC